MRSGLELRISSNTSGTAIRYTTDGSTPSDTVGTVYSGPLTVTATTTLKAIAYASGYTNTGVVTAAYHVLAATPSVTGLSPASVRRARKSPFPVLVSNRSGVQGPSGWAVHLARY